MAKPAFCIYIHTCLMPSLQYVYRSFISNLKSGNPLGIPFSRYAFEHARGPAALVMTLSSRGAQQSQAKTGACGWRAAARTGWRGVDVDVLHVLAQVHGGVRLGHADDGLQVAHRDRHALAHRALAPQLRIHLLRQPPQVIAGSRAKQATPIFPRLPCADQPLSVTNQRAARGGARSCAGCGAHGQQATSDSK